MRGLLTLALALLTSAALGQPLRTVSQDGNTPKFNLRSPQRPGICPEVMRAVEALDGELRFSGLEQVATLKRIDALLAAGQIDAFCGLVRTGAREAAFDFLPTPLYSSRHRLAARADDPIQVSRLSELRSLGPDEPVMVNRGSVYEDVLDQLGGIPFDAGIADPPASLRKLLSKRGRLYYYSEVELLYYIGQADLREQVRLLPRVYREDKVLFAVARQAPPASVQRLRRALERLSQDGTLARIVAGYSGG
jgi:ABC-type amino acid transport substrate-binding protein